MTVFDEKELQHLRAFFAHNTGQKLLIRLRESDLRPKIRPTAAPHEVQMDAGSQLGYDRCIENIEKLTASASTENEPQETPSLRNTRL